MTVSIAFIGCGLAVRDLHVPALRKLGLLDAVVGVSTGSNESSQRAADWLVSEGALSCEAMSIERLLGDPAIDVVVVAVPIAVTDDVARRVVLAGKTALVEKPIATTTAAALDTFRLAQENGVTLLAGENFRFRTEFARMRELAEQGLVGDVKLIFWNDLHFTPSDGKYAETPWRIIGEHPGGYLVDGGTHIVAGLRQMTAASVVSVHAVATRTQDYLSHQADALLINLKYDDGTIGHLALGYGVFDPESRHPKVCGTKGTLALMDDGIYLISGSGKALLEERPTDAGFTEEWKLVVSAVTSDDAKRRIRELTFESIRDLQLLEAAIASSSSGKEIEVPSIAK